MEVDGQVVEEDEEAAGEEEDEGHANVDVALFEDAADEDGALAVPPLDEDEEDHDQPETDECTDDSRVVPGLGDAAPLEGEDEATDAGDDGKSAHWVHLHDLLQ